MTAPILYLYIHKKLDDYKHWTGSVNWTTIQTVFGRCFNIKKSLTPAIVKEMENYELLKKNAKNNYMLLNTDKSKIILDISKVNKIVGLW